jgi:antitoxin ParD1/3/4
MPTRNINLTDHLDRLVASAVESGRFSNASEVVREGLRLLEQRQQEDEAKLAWLCAAADDATASIARGEGLAFESVDDLALYVRDMRSKSVPTSNRGRKLA